MNIEARGMETSRDPEERAVPIKSTPESGASPDAVAAWNKEASRLTWIFARSRTGRTAGSSKRICFMTW